MRWGAPFSPPGVLQLRCVPHRLCPFPERLVWEKRWKATRPGPFGPALTYCALSHGSLQATAGLIQEQEGGDLRFNHIKEIRPGVFRNLRNLNTL
uniref:Uncharacterized protein n=1 Tax=Sphaerodactylus townsendi TaxID=933632 RepID=A0ACB8F6E8_9SAUR